MILKVAVVSVCAAVFAVVALGGPPAEAAAKKKRIATQYRPVPVSMRPVSRITVRARSFLDGGTEVLPGERKFLNYAFPLNSSPLSVIENTGFYHRDPLPGPFDLPDRRNPYPWNWCTNC